MLTPIWFEILVSLGAGDRHGYAILQDVEERTEGAVSILPGTLYRALDRLLEQGWIREVPSDPGEEDARRRYYRLTAKGREVAAAEVARLTETLSAARRHRLVDGRR